MELSDVSPISEALSTRMDLVWTQEEGGFAASFQIEERQYGISVQVEVEGGLELLRTDFHALVDGKVSHALTGFQEDRFKVVGIVTNGIEDQFPGKDGYYFVAKKAVDPEGYESRVKTYRRIMDRLRIELGLHHTIESNPDNTIFYLASTVEAMHVMTGR